ncbi:patatin-like phospholipase family protein [Streptomyces gamaensis]|uniref:Patatin-like phospholipase family protein n=1 Tax=Streptomyces gamaensis TaxID=1763542 RepID=A0ABW0YSF3_9ACTN
MSADADIRPASTSGRTAFVLGGGGKLGGYQVGMLRALFERGVAPDLVLGTSVGSVQGAMLAADPTPALCDRLAEFWKDIIGERVMSVTARDVLASVVGLRPALARMDALREVVSGYLGADTRIEDLALPFECVAASIERAAAHYFDAGPLVPALMASCAVPGLWPPVRIGEEHYVDGGVVETVPVSRAVGHGATTVYVLRMRQQEPPLLPARRPWQVGPAVFEISRRHRLTQILNARPAGVRMYILPSGEVHGDASDARRRLSVREEQALLQRRAETGYRAAGAYLDALAEGRSAALAFSANPVARSYLTTSRRADGSEPVFHSGAISPFLAAKHRALFARYDLDGDGLVARENVVAVARSLCAAFGREPDSPAATALCEAYEVYWRRLCEAAALAPETARLDRDTFEDALARLAGSRPAYHANLLPMVTAVLAAADIDGDGILDTDEIHRVLGMFLVDGSDAKTLIRRLDTNGDGIISLDELNDAFRDYFTSEEHGYAGNMLFGNVPT